MIALAQQLKLTPQQEVEVMPILKAEAPKFEAIKNDPSMSGMQKMEQLHAIHSENAPQLQKILTPAQYQELQAIREADIKKAVAAKRAGHPDSRPAADISFALHTALETLCIARLVRLTNPPNTACSDHCRYRSFHRPATVSASARTIHRRIRPQKQLRAAVRHGIDARCQGATALRDQSTGWLA